MEAKRKLNLEVKTLETRIAPGACRATHNSMYHNPNGPEAEAHWNQYQAAIQRQASGNYGNPSENVDYTMSPAGVPVIGIN